EEDFRTIIAEVAEEESIIEVPVEYTLLLLRDALHTMRESGALLPTEFFLRRGMFRDLDLQPLPYQPQFAGFSPQRLLTDSSFTLQTAELLEEEGVGEWFIATPAVYDLAEEWGKLPERVRESSRESRKLVQRFCTEIVEPERDCICRRLLLTADLLQRVESPRALVEKVAACAESVASRLLPAHMHPFLRRIAVESMELAAEALAEGYDLRDEYGDEDDE
ncbi:MAG TPA: HEAT repeat domain-containing protein, partial [Verrucomicrobiae bacterium]|nr:HEAT repeat domain-containing protein [Verrucomicrobiae bacterium]